VAYSYVLYTGNGTTTNYTFPFQYLKETDVKVRVSGVLTGYTFLNSSTVTISPAPSSGSVIEIRRETLTPEAPVDFADGSVLLERDLDLLAKYNLYASQEAYDIALDSMTTDTGGNLDAKGRRVVNLAAPINPGDAVNLQKLQYDYPKVSTVADSITNVNKVASDLGGAVTFESDLGFITDPIAGNDLGGNSNIVTVANNIADIQAVAGNLTTILAADDNAAAAASSASSASSSATTATTQATQASSSASAAASSATSASGSASTATTKASEASASATDSAASATLANDWATKTSGPVAGGEYSAKYHANAAISSASAASSSATAASGSATAAASSATAASTSASDAAASAAATAALLDNFDDRYLGPKSSAPTLDNDGNALAIGALYFDTTTGKMRVYTATGWVDASAASQAALTVYRYTATSGQTTFSGTDVNSLPLSYLAGGIVVTLNGSVIVGGGVDYTASNGTSVVLATGATVGDTLEVYAFSSFSIASLNGSAIVDGTITSDKLASSLDLGTL
jgi:hypothetical protein